MIISELKESFENQISGIYANSEISELFSIFCTQILGINKFELRRSEDHIISEEQNSVFIKIITELKAGKPYQQILGETEFYGLKFFVDENVLIPRPETEELLELAITEIHKNKVTDLKILDIGTGSGIIPIVLKKKFPEAKVSAIDFSEKALKTAKKNADFHEADINFIHQNYLEEYLLEVYDIIISNPPYIGIDEEKEIADSVKEFEPKMALFSPTSNALIFYEKIAEDCNNHLTEKGMVFLEINQKLGEETKALFTNVLSEVHLIKDISGNDRFVFGRK
ncbi:peptide chain release factor N(5)-glutamine methyltransferase [Chryseobacterium sp. VAUSW3]|uniref:peptide chain release factor N(5)-glutamine methyltransferase n=1 Tax=Chryseobacterium sp. VAUSW3 TaxID=2010998 RepID=UPI000B4CC49E|nr:peptide chain release factor N(5)-glutamine methyltransferase [Chryseobacterium sp. VAUSW3]OWR13874.1 protein-(glutamine-N5) methyltransferase, release factor-specific [Chryseobacterium sp. VAUSW3]